MSDPDFNDGLREALATLATFSYAVGSPDTRGHRPNARAKTRIAGYAGLRRSEPVPLRWSEIYCSTRQAVQSTDSGWLR